MSIPGRKMILLIVILNSYCFVSAQSVNTSSGILFNDDWKFSLGDPARAGEKDFDDAGWRKLDLPHDWSIEGAPDRQNASNAAGGYFPTGVGWYRKKFIAPSSWKGKEVSIWFEGVYMNAGVFVNGKPLGVHPYGYTTFYYDITSLLDPGKENVIAVRVDNSQQINCRWYSGSGIYRPVRLIVKDPIHIDPWSLAITTPDVNPDKATIRIDALVKNDMDAARDIALSTTILDKGNKAVAHDKMRLRLDGKGEQRVTRTIAVSRPLLWSVDSPNLYRAEMTLIQGGRQRDRQISRFGIRSIAFSTGKGFQLNGRTIKLNGGCVHHDNGCLGAAAFDRAEERKVQLLKMAGFNAVRTSHNPPSTAFLDACDRYGLLVIDEAFDGWRTQKNVYDYARYFDDWWRRDLTSMVLRDRNHPSIVIWSIGNEIIERKSPDAVKTARELVALVHRYDATRPVTSAMASWDKDWEIYDPLFAVQDLGGYNYLLNKAPSDHERVPSRIIVQTESYPRDAFANWDLVQHHSYIIGDFVWTAIDYLGESSIGRNIYPGEPPGEHWEGDHFPWHGAYCGDIDLTGWRKPIAHYRNILNNSTESLYMAVREPNPDTGKIKETLWSVWPTWESWSWPGREGKDIQVEVYSKHPKVRLYLNGHIVGEKSCTQVDEYKATFTLPYSPGVLKAVGIDQGRVADSMILRTADRPDAIRLKPDRTTLRADGQDLSFIEVELTDRSGIINPHADNRLMFKVDGPATIAGIANADLQDLDKYVGNYKKAWHGRALVVIRSAHRAGKITIAVSSPGLKDGVVTLNAGPPSAR
ncbi:MAG TPA: glycoside hydrolase family 2 TIM barrel-domain containing protein [Puia sp.]|nr:glycoside hydrolase family 2 TIM barrel-domain containing protein [Puia sp.]